MMGYNQLEWCLNRHKITNHMYDKYLPYEFHLRMVFQIAGEFKHLIPDEPYDVNHHDKKEPESYMEVIEKACWGHDLIEDTRCSYNDVKNQLGQNTADVIFALTNEKGKNRAERGSDKYYNGIRNVRGAVFVKLCDRIANVRYSKLTKSDKFGMYFNENEKFLAQVGAVRYPEMRDHLVSLFEREKEHQKEEL